MRALLLDAGGVLLHPAWEEVAEVAERHGIRLDLPAVAVAEYTEFVALDEGPVQPDIDRWRTYMGRVLRRGGAPGDARTETLLDELGHIHRTRHLWRRVPADVRRLVARARAAGVPLAVVSNSNGALRGVLEELGLAGAFAVIVDSHEVGVEKPDPRIFEFALGPLGLGPGEVCFVGDSTLIDGQAAARGGIPFLLLDRGRVRRSGAGVIHSLDEVPRLGWA